MQSHRSSRIASALSAAALLISVAALQSPLWFPQNPSSQVTARAGGTTVFHYDRDIQTASIFKKQTATLSAGGPHQLIIHGHAAGRTTMLIRYADGESRVFEIVVLAESI